jgi:hypothetical protein
LILTESADYRHTLCLPRPASTSCDQAVLVDQATGMSLSRDAVLVEVDPFWSTAPDPGNCTPRNIRGCSAGARFFVHGNDAGKTLRTEDGENSRESFPPLAICPSMTDYRVRHLVTG